MKAAFHAYSFQEYQGKYPYRLEVEKAGWSAMIDKRPLLIARCTDVADVISAVQFGREDELLIATRGGGHNGPAMAKITIVWRRSRRNTTRQISSV